MNRRRGRAASLLALARLAGVSVVVLGLVACTPRDVAPAAVVPGLAEALPTLNAVTIEQGGETLKIERQGAQWMIPKAGWRADRRWLQPLLLELSEARCDELKTADPSRYSQIGIDWPSSTPVMDAATGAFARPTGRVSVSLAAGEQTVIIGFPQARGGTYLRAESSPQGCLSDATLRLPAKVSEWMDPRLWSERPVSPAWIQIEDGNQAPLRLIAVDGRYRVEGQLLALTPLPDALVAAALDLRQLDLRASSDAEPERVIRFKAADGAYAVALRREADATWAWVIEAPDTQGSGFAGREFRLPPDVADPLWASRESLGA